MTALLLAAAVVALAVAAWPARRLITANPGRRARARRDDTALPEPGGEWYAATPQHPDTGPPLYLPVPVEVHHEQEVPTGMITLSAGASRALAKLKELERQAGELEAAHAGPEHVVFPTIEVDEIRHGPGDPAPNSFDQRSWSVGKVTAPQPEDPYDVATPEDQAGELVGLAGQPGKNGSDGAGLIGLQSSVSLPSPVPAPEPMLADYRDETGTWERIVVEVAAEAGGQ